jgi:large subunit ribosomal protein L15
MQLHELKKSSGTKKAKRVGRGGTRGKTSGRGHKGQKSRAGHKIRPAERDLIKKIPKRRGHGKNRARTVNPDRVRPFAVNLRDLETAFTDGEKISPRELAAKKLVKTPAGRVPTVKILGIGKLTKKFKVSGCETSKSAKEAIEKAGGEVISL